MSCLPQRLVRLHSGKNEILHVQYGLPIHPYSDDAVALLRCSVHANEDDDLSVATADENKGASAERCAVVVVADNGS